MIGRPARPPTQPARTTAMPHPLLGYYQALERASDDMLAAARDGDWDRVMRLEGACAVLISQLKHAAHGQPRLDAEQAREKRRLMQHILANDAQIRRLAEPWLDDLDRLLAVSSPRAMH